MASTRDPLGNAMRILRHIVESPRSEFGVRELAEVLGAHPSTVSRLLTTMRRHRLVGRSEVTGAYYPHPDLIRMGLLASRKHGVRAVARPQLEALRDRFNESAFIALYDPVEKQIFRVDSVASSHPLRYVVELDRWTDVYRGASGLGVLAFLPARERADIVERADRAGEREDNPRLRKEYLAPRLADIRARGYAITHGHRIEGAVGISAPFVGPDGAIAGDVILTVPEVRFNPEDEPDYADAVLGAAHAITSGLAGVVVERPSSAPRADPSAADVHD